VATSPHSQALATLEGKALWEWDGIVAYTVLITQLIRGVEVHVHGIPSFKAPFGVTSSVTLQQYN